MVCLRGELYDLVGARGEELPDGADPQRRSVALAAIHVVS